MHQSPDDDAIADVHYVACRECGQLIESVEAAHLTSRDCTGAVTTREAYRRKHPDAPVVTRALSRERASRVE